jgi:hypothetical protein
MIDEILHDMITIEQNQPLLIWTWIDTGTPTSHNSIVKLAIHILSVIANSASIECDFSDFSIQSVATK